MGGRIVCPDKGEAKLLLKVSSHLQIGMKVKGQNGKEYPTSVDYFIPSGKYAEVFTRAYGEKPNTVQIMFVDDDPELSCNERLEYWSSKGELVARGDGRTFEIWDGNKYAPYTVDKSPNIMAQVAERYPKPKRNENDNGWDIVLTLRFLIPLANEVLCLWDFKTKGAASSVNNIRDTYDAVQKIRGTVRGSVFDLSVQFAKSVKPGVKSRYPVVSLTCNDSQVARIQEHLNKTRNSTLLLADK